MARAVGVTPQAVQLWEKNGAPNRGRAQKVAGLLGLTIEDVLFPWADDDTPLEAEPPKERDEQQIRRTNLQRLIDLKYKGKAVAFANQYGCEPSYVNNLLRGNQNIGERAARKIERMAGQPKYWLDQIHDEGATTQAINQTLATYHVERNEATFEVPVFNAEPTMGLGAPLPEHETVLGSIQLSRAWVRNHLKSVTNPANLASLTAYGDSMTPTFADGDILLVDRGVRDVTIDGVYVIALRRELFVKRVQRRLMDGAVVIKSDNPMYDPETIPNSERADLAVLGRVLWAWRGVKL